MTRTFQQKVELAIADPPRLARFLRYRARGLARGITGLGAQPERLDDRLMRGLGGHHDAPVAPAAEDAALFEEARETLAQHPLMRDARTYNPSHPDYHPKLARNYPGRIFGRRRPCDNLTYAALTRMAWLTWVPDRRWRPVLADALAEASSVPGASQVFERRRFDEDYLADLRRKYGAHYQPGWVNLEDALFLYWLVRQAKPKTIVQTGVCNGLSAAFMMLALAKNGPDGTLHVIDLAPVFDPDDPAWTVAGQVYGVIIPEGKTTGWLVPDLYRDRFEVWNGDARDLLPKMVDRLDAIDFFYHDSDHTYDHMTFEFAEAKRKLAKGGLIVGDDVSWNASVWDFADRYGVPSYNFKGAVGVAFF
jgi:predicted O-methyltransferase YrrM